MLVVLVVAVGSSR